MFVIAFVFQYCDWMRLNVQINVNNSKIIN